MVFDLRIVIRDSIEASCVIIPQFMRLHIE